MDDYYLTKNLTQKTTSYTKRIDRLDNINEHKNIRITRINIDSRYRNISSKNIISSNISYLNNNPLTFTQNSNIIKINQLNHGYNIEDKIVIQGINYSYTNLNNSLTFFLNSSYIRINHPNHGLNLNDTTIKIKIENVTGNLNGGRILLNIPINEINKLQTIYFVKDNLEIPNINYYYIKINNQSNTDYNYNLSSIKIYFTQICGIPINQINANYPTNASQTNGYAIVYNIIDSNNYTIQTVSSATSSGVGGGRNIWITKVTDFIEGYPLNNYYKIPLKKTFYNVTRIKMISTEFPNTEKVIKSTPANKQNNLLYFQIEIDGNDIYSIEITPGNYTVSTLVSAISNAINNVNRTNMILLNANSTGNYLYTTKCISNISVSSETDIFSMQILQVVTLVSPLSLSNSAFTDGFTRLRINHPTHNLLVGDTITVSNAIETNNIPTNVLNSTFIIERVLDYNTYEVKLPKYNPDNLQNNVTNGGSVVVITYPIKFKLLFDRPNTLGQILGFRNPNEPTSVTIYDTTITNNSLYEYEYENVDTSIPRNNIMNLSGDNYIIMSSPLFKDSSYTSGQINGVFVKLLLAGDPGSIMYNQFIQLGEFFKTPISSLSEFEVTFYDPSGDLFYFNNIEHSYTLEIYEDISQS
jgi:hypothetical protein